MLVRKISIENVRSFLERTELALDDLMSIIIGPNGGGKTNILDVVVITLRKHIFASKYAARVTSGDQKEKYEVRVNDSLKELKLEKHSAGLDKDQIVEIEIEVTDSDLINMKTMKDDRDKLLLLTRDKYVKIDMECTSSWVLENIVCGTKFKYRIFNGVLDKSNSNTQEALSYLQYLQMYELDSQLRDEFELAPLATPLMYFPVSRTAAGFQSGIELAGFNQYEAKRHIDAASSRSGASVVHLAIGRLAQQYRLLQELPGINAMEVLRARNHFKNLTELLSELGYEWELVTVSALKNQYDIRLKKQGITFLVSNASSGEKELLVYLFTIFALNVRNALIIIDEPELHLHPKWQKILIKLFIKLSQSTGNQFLMATHSPTFISPDSIQYVSRVYSSKQRSRICQIELSSLPDAKHLLNIINSQNNERMLFADKIVLVEGVSDRIFFEKLIERSPSYKSIRSTIEVINVDGKGLFRAYSKLLEASKVPFSIIADLDYVEQLGTPNLKSIFKPNSKKIKQDVIDNKTSIDGDAIVSAIDNAIANGSWSEAEHIWAYIKSRRAQLREDMTATEVAELNDFIHSKYTDDIYILKKGSLEAYLPEECSRKDIEKLIKLIEEDSFFDGLCQDAMTELEDIIEKILVF